MSRQIYFNDWRKCLQGKVINKHDLSIQLRYKLESSHPFYLVIISLDSIALKASEMSLYVSAVFRKLLFQVGADSGIQVIGENEISIILQPSEVNCFINSFGGINRHTLMPTSSDSELICCMAAGVSALSICVNNSDELLRTATVACKVSRLQGSKQVVMYNREFENLYSPLYGLSEIKKTIRDSYALYQPVVDCSNNNIIYYEALIRHECISTFDLIQTCKYYHLWSELFDQMMMNVMQLYKFLDVPISINVSPHQIIHAEDLFKSLTNAEASGVDLSKLILEITESEPIMNMSIFECNLRSLMNMGVRFSLDDFGAGYSFFDRLKISGLEHIKLDKNIVYRLYLDENRKALVKAVKKYCDELGVLLIAEGVELDEDIDFLVSMGITNMQGFAFYEPMTEKQVMNFKLNGVIE
ncbi:EAL domain-containing protein [Aeromonas jandaei]|uniref:EAL domain-containing protein n=1 Tax=Aeromonas jandaei TaxID=650 RepID=UPI003BA2C622